MDLYFDKPVTDQQQDRFQRYAFAARVAGLIANHRIHSSLVVGLYGKWGSGKSTVLNFIERELPEETIAIKFNPWLYSDEKDLLTSFFNVVARAVGVKLRKKRERIGKALAEYADGIGIVTGRVGISASAIKELGNKLNASSVSDLKKRVDDIIVEVEQNIVIFIDDIDRLDVNEMQQIFKLVKLVADFPRTSYVLAFDDELVAAALGPKYGEGSRVAGYGFLEKIVQLPLTIPKASAVALSRHVIGLINEILRSNQIVLERAGSHQFLPIFEQLFLPLTTNPRVGSRYANAVNFALPLLIDEVNVTDLLLIEGLKIYYPLLHSFVRANSSLFLGNSFPSTKKPNEDIRKKQIEDAMQAASHGHQENAQLIIITLFPNLATMFGQPGPRDSDSNEWYQNQRVCSSRYFERYFTYVVTEGDISDAHFFEVISRLEDEDDDDFAQTLKIEFKDFDWSDVLTKLRLWNVELSSDLRQKLAKVIARLGNLFPDNNEWVLGSSTQKQAARFISQLLREGDNASLVERTREVILVAEPIENSLNILNEVAEQYTRASYADRGIFTVAEFNSLQNIVVEKYKASVKSSGSLFGIMDGYEASWLLTYWANDPVSNSDNSVQDFMDDIVDRMDGGELELLDLFSAYITSYGEHSQGRTYRSKLFFDDYSRLEKLDRRDVLYGKLVEKYGDQTGLLTDIDKRSDSRNIHSELSDVKLIGFYQWYHENSSNYTTEQQTGAHIEGE